MFEADIAYSEHADMKERIDSLEHEKHCIEEHFRIQAELASKALMEIPNLERELDTARKRIKYLEEELDSRVRRAIAVLRGDECDDDDY